MRALAFGLLALACGAAPRPAAKPEPATVSVAPPAKDPEPEPPAPTGPLVLDEEGERPRWLDPPTPMRGRKRWVYDSLLASGDQASLSRTSTGEHFGFDEELGVVGPLDGPCHATRAAADARRDRELGRRGWRVLRLTAELVERDLGEAVARVRAALGG